MELWVRSQDKNKLMIVNRLYIPLSRTDEDFGIYAKDEIRDELLGIYKTKERALEVLDEIQKILQPQIIINYESKLEFLPECTVQNVVKTIPKTEITELSTYVYQMPED